MSYFAAQRSTSTYSVIQILQKYNLNDLGNQPITKPHQTIDVADNTKILLSTRKYKKKLDVFQRKFVSLPQ